MLRRLFDWLVPDRALRGIGIEAGTMPFIREENGRFVFAGRVPISVPEER